MKKIILIFTSILILGSLGFSNDAFAITVDSVQSKALSDSNSECHFTFDESTAPLIMSESAKIKLRMVAEEMFVKSGLPGQWLPTYKQTFMENCEDKYNLALSMSPDVRPTDRIPVLDREEEIILDRAFSQGMSNSACYQDGVNDYNSKKNIGRANPAIAETRLLLGNLKIPYEMQTVGFLKMVSGEFYEGCNMAYEKGYADAKKGDSSLSEDERNIIDSLEKARAEGKASGLNDPACRAEGKNDYENNESREPNIFEINLRQASTNPYNIAFQFNEYENFRTSYEEGCSQAYYSGYDSARSAASLGGDGGCLIATAAYGTELSSEVQNLREIRNKMYETNTGGDVMRAVNNFYYSFSPTVADWERENPIFKETIRLLITPSMTSFAILDHNTIDSELGLVGYVISAVMLNVGMYFVAPAVVIWHIKKRI